MTKYHNNCCDSDSDFEKCRKKCGPVGPYGPAGPVGPMGDVGPAGPQGQPGQDSVGQLSWASGVDTVLPGNYFLMGQGQVKNETDVIGVDPLTFDTDRTAFSLVIGQDATLSSITASIQLLHGNECSYLSGYFDFLVSYALPNSRTFLPGGHVQVIYNNVEAGKEYVSVNTNALSGVSLPAGTRIVVEVNPVSQAPPAPCAPDALLLFSQLSFNASVVLV